MFLSQTCSKNLLRNTSPVLFALKLDKEFQRGRGLWKYYNSLLPDEDFVLKMKDYVAMSIGTLNK